MKASSMQTVAKWYAAFKSRIAFPSAILAQNIKSLFNVIGAIQAVGQYLVGAKRVTRIRRTGKWWSGMKWTTSDMCEI